MRAIRPWYSSRVGILCRLVPVASYPSACLTPGLGPSREGRVGSTCWRHNHADGKHTYFLRAVDHYSHRSFDFRDPTNTHFFHVTDEDTKIEKLKAASGAPPTVSASMATALMAFRGVAIKMLVDQRLGAASLTMFLVEYEPGGKIDPHDHPFEETYYILEGEVDAVADGVPYSLKPGDLFWTGVGSVHAFYNNSDRTVRWLETQSPQPPVRNGFRFARDWEYLKEKLANA